MASIRGKRVFLSGRMSDDSKTFHAHQFVDAHILCKEAGAKSVYDPAMSWLAYNDSDRTHADWMFESVHELTRKRLSGDAYWQVLVSLPGWELSEGARTERTVAEACGMEVIELEDIDD